MNDLLGQIADHEWVRPAINVGARLMMEQRDGKWRLWIDPCGREPFIERQEWPSGCGTTPEDAARDLLAKLG